eukprot:6205758-Pleurochrysis_carterae.AAC.4
MLFGIVSCTGGAASVALLTLLRRAHAATVGVTACDALHRRESECVLVSSFANAAGPDKNGPEALASSI